jgi:hypothetical protein
MFSCRFRIDGTATLFLHLLFSWLGILVLLLGRVLGCLLLGRVLGCLLLGRVRFAEGVSPSPISAPPVLAASQVRDRGGGARIAGHTV